MVIQYCVDCKTVAELATILAAYGNREGGALVGVCRECYGPEWHRFLHSEEDDDGVEELEKYCMMLAEYFFDAIMNLEMNQGVIRERKEEK